MDNASQQNALLAIVETWDLSDKPEFRGFRCANCQEYFKGNAWHFLLHTGGYVTPVHFCEQCKNVFESGSPVQKPRVRVDRERFRPAFDAATEVALDTISDAWNLDAEPTLKTFTCDACGKPLPNVEAYHVWRNKNGMLIEYHFDRACGDKILGSR